MRAAGDALPRVPFQGFRQNSLRRTTKNAKEKILSHFLLFIEKSSALRLWFRRTEGRAHIFLKTVDTHRLYMRETSSTFRVPRRDRDLPSVSVRRRGDDQRGYKATSEHIPRPSGDRAGRYPCALREGMRIFQNSYSQSLIIFAVNRLANFFTYIHNSVLRFFG